MIPSTSAAEPGRPSGIREVIAARASASPEIAVRAAHDHERRWELAVDQARETSERVEE